MREISAGLLLFITLAFVGCEPPKAKEYDGPTVERFVGKVVHDGKPVQFGADETVSLQLRLQKKGIVYGVPLNKDGSFKLGWMPIGRYAIIFERHGQGRSMRPERTPITDNFEIDADKTEYTIELGPSFKP